MGERSQWPFVGDLLYFRRTPGVRQRSCPARASLCLCGVGIVLRPGEIVKRRLRAGRAMKGLLCLCVQNSSRSQMAEGLARAILGTAVRVQSAGSRPAGVNPLAVAAMAEIGIDISAQRSKPLESIDAKTVDTVITLCAEEVCPVFSSGVRRLHWPIADPAAADVSLSQARRLANFRAARDQIKARIEALAADFRDPPTPETSR